MNIEKGQVWHFKISHFLYPYLALTFNFRDPLKLELRKPVLIISCVVFFVLTTVWCAPT